MYADIPWVRLPLLPPPPQTISLPFCEQKEFLVV